MAKRPVSVPTTRREKQGEKLKAPVGGLVVRMYRQGLGDCFLLAFSGDQRRKRKTRYVLIDCGVHSRQESGSARLAQVMDDIVEATGGELDVVIATHEHADHLSGFVQNDSPFLTGKIKKLGQLWLGWTENVGDAQADLLRKKRGTTRSVIDKALHDIVTQRDAASLTRNNKLNPLAERIRRFKDFESHPDDALDDESIIKRIEEICDSRSDPVRAHANVDQLRLASSSSGALGYVSAAPQQRKNPTKNELALGLLAALADDVVYGEPGRVVEIPSVNDARAYVLGPPRDKQLLRKDKPSKVQKSDRDGSSDGGEGDIYKEVYLAGSSGTQALMYAPAFGEDLPFEVGPDFPKDEMRFPFRDDYRRPYIGSSAETVEQNDDLPREIKSFFDEIYCSPEKGWRRIDDDWLDACEDLALNLDSDTNNTSLVIAFEWGEPGTGQVLLFPGDAQVGSWLSWRRQDYTAGDVTTTADELLRRTILYKVGHHASHNATGRRDSTETTVTHPLGVPFGLELMDDIVAMIPVDRDAAQKDRPWEMPYTPLYRRLRERARRRVLRSDLSLEPLKAPPEKQDLKPTNRWSKTPGLKNVRWRAASKTFDAAPETALYYDVEFRRASR